jgi:hypothetical protein
MKTLPAFPTNAMSHDEFDTGMTLRDYFAAKALPIAIQEMNEAESYNINDAAIVAYQYADAMMDARQE